MKIDIFLLIFLSLCCSINSDPPSGYILVWSDEFEGSSLNTKKWEYSIGAEPFWGNNELEFYTKRQENVYVENGLLHIRAQKESYGGKDYTSGRIHTKGKVHFKYGFIEARISLPRGMGIWPAFWLLVPYGESDKVDIVEAVNTENIVYSTCHWFPNGEHKYKSGQSEEFDITQFHNYSMLWTESVLQLAIDGKEHLTLNITDEVDDTNAFHNNFYFLLNVAVGGDRPGFNIDDSQFPTEMKVDYVRIYKKFKKTY